MSGDAVLQNRVAIEFILGFVFIKFHLTTQDLQSVFNRDWSSEYMMDIPSE